MKRVIDIFEIKNLKFKHILDIPELMLNRPVTCITGASGSGKTTLLRMLNRLNVPDSGTIRYNGTDISSVDSVRLRRRVVMLGQTPVIYGGDIRDNLQIGLEFSQKPPAGDNVLKDTLEQVGLSKGLDESCGTLSGGEKQRLCLARIMLMDAETYLLDEPSAALDSETEHFVIHNLAAFVTDRHKEMIMVTHSPAIAGEYSDGLVRIEKGRIGGAEDV